MNSIINGMLCNSYASLVPAYGRDYKNKKEILKDFNGHKDFILMPESRYINKPQIKKGITVHIRYKKLTSVCAIKVT
jgi:hypothetical protein